jgi:hypothetical protein
MKTLLLLLFLPLAAIAAKKSAPIKPKGEPRCFLHGIAVNADTSKKNQYGALQDIIRLNFDAKTSQKCERMIRSYCKVQLLGKDQKIKTLSGYFRDAGEKNPRVHYEIDGQCEITKPLKDEESPLEEDSSN